MAVWCSFEIVADGRRVKGSYAYDRDAGTVRVRSAMDSEKTSQLGTARPSDVAHQLLLALVNEGEA